MTIGRDRAVRRQLLIGACAGPFFVLSSLLQAALRDGFNLAGHPPSALALGDGGWLQIATFIVAGSGFIVGARGLRHVLRQWRSRWPARCIFVFGGALVAAGVLPMDPAFGFPPGTPAGVGGAVSWHAAVHGVLFPLGFAALLAGCITMARCYRQQRRPVAQWCSLMLGPIVLFSTIWPNLGHSPDGRFLPMWLGVVMAFLWTSGVLGDAARAVPSSVPSPQAALR